MKILKSLAFWKLVLKFFIFSIIIMVVGLAVMMIVNPDIQNTLSLFENDTSETLSEAEGLDKVWEYILNNGFMVIFQMFLFALIPIPFLYTLNITVTAIATGVALGLGFLISIDDGISILVGALPHVVIELFAYAVFAGALLTLNQSIYRPIMNKFRKNKKPGLSFLKAIKNTIIVYGAGVLPLIILGAFVETYVADFLMDIFTPLYYTKLNL